MGNPADRVATYVDLRDVPDNMVGEILNGELVTHPRPAPRHSHTASAIGAFIFSSFNHKQNKGDGGWWILDEPECHLADDVVVPDIAGWRKANMPELPETAWISVKPDWVCEVISPSTAKYDRGVKRQIYAREGVGHYWIVDPEAKMVEVFALNEGNWMLLITASDDEVVNLPPFEVLPFDLSALWA